MAKKKKEERVFGGKETESVEDEQKKAVEEITSCKSSLHHTQWERWDVLHEGKDTEGGCRVRKKEIEACKDVAESS